MMVNNISRINPMAYVQNTKKTQAPASTKATSDEVSISKEAQALYEAQMLKQIADETPDVRMDLVEQIKMEIRDPNFLSDENIAAAADQILNSYGL